MSLHPSRRAVLRAGLAVPLLAACTDGSPEGPPPPPDPDLALHAAAVERERALLEAYDVAVLAAPGLVARLALVRAEHAEHLAALEAVDPAPTPSPSASPPPSPSPSAPAPPPAPTEPATVLAGLVALEADAATGHGAAAVEASRPLALVLATLAASEASHGVALA